MKIGMIACSRQAYELMHRVKREWENRQPDSEIVAKVKCSALEKESMRESLGACAGEWWDRMDAIVFFGAAGIAVRSIASSVGHKCSDPAVLVIDETGAFCISLLSGHMGGANELTRQMADILQAIPVITTATDREGKFAVDEFARKNDLALRDWIKAKEISVRILGGQAIRMTTDIEGIQVSGNLPEEVIWCPPPRESQELSAGHSQSDLRSADVMLSYRDPGQTVPESVSCESPLWLIPRMIAVGIGCRKGISKERIAAAVSDCMKEEGICSEALCIAASIDLKREEPGLLDYCREQKLPFVTYPASALRQAEGDFSESLFVSEVTGVDCVCERSAVLASKGRLLCRKKIYDGVTVALAEKKGGVTF